MKPIRISRARTAAPALAPLRRAGLVLAALLPALCFAWGQEGHSVVAELASRQLSEKAREAIARDILVPGASLASISNWADTVAHGARPDTYGWHFVDLPLAQSTYLHSRDCVYRPPRPKDAPQGAPDPAPIANDCVVMAIERNAAIVGNAQAPRAERADALRFLVHFVGDVHQPMHTVDDGRGGNAVQVSFPCEAGAKCATNANTNLHALWDSGLYRARYFSWGEHLDALLRDGLDSGRASEPDACAALPSTQTQAACWALEAHQLAQQPGVFAANGAVLGDDYLRRVEPLRDRQLLRAGRRLARLLDRLLAGP